jgi:hypothetical protein
MRHPARKVKNLEAEKGVFGDFFKNFQKKLKWKNLKIF